jgi:Dolichyl-phosphate-mannose-protein mannosyltransferase
MPYMQELIHKLEVGPWIRHLKVSLAVLALLGLFVGYNWRNYRNMGSPEAMDAAQVGRNLSEGRGFSTMFIRQVSIYLIKGRNDARIQAGDAAAKADPALIKGDHPDLANPPVYPLVLAGLIKVLPMNWEAETTKPFWSRDGRFARYQPDFLIALFNEFLFLIVILLTFLLARRLFDPTVAWTVGLLLLASELLWRFSVSGLSTILLLLIFVGLAWLVVLLESEVREPKWGPRAPALLVIGIGVLLGLGMLTRYSFGWLLIPVVVHLALFGGPRRAALCLLAVAVFALMITPWVYRNMKLCGLPFGTATFAIMEGTGIFPGHKLERSLAPNLEQVFFSGFIPKLSGHGRTLLQQELPRLGGTWLTPLFLTGLLLGFRNPAIRRLRYFTVMSLGMLMIVQALGRTQLSEDTPEMNTENVIVLVLPFVFIYGVALFYMLLDQMNLPFRGFRIVVIGAFGLIMALPMVYTFLPPRPTPLMYPPYHPQIIRQISSWMNKHELLMSDAPWAVAWYGQRQCIWLSQDANEDFFAVNDMLKPVRGLYLTQITMDARFISEWLKPGPGSLNWGSFLLNSMLIRKAVPETFPLREALPGMLPQQLFLTDSKRWQYSEPIEAPAEAEPEKTKPPAAKEK